MRRIARKLICLLAVVCAVAYAQMAENVVREFVYRVFTGGLALDRHSSLLRPDECQDVRNILFDESVSLKTAGGVMATSIGGLGAIPPIYEYVRSDGTRRMVLKSGTSIYWSYGDGRWYVLASGLSANEQMSFATHQNVLWMTNRVDGVMTWDGTTVTRKSNLMRARFVVSYNGKVWLLGSYDNASYCVFSLDGYDPVDDAAWSMAHAIDIDSDNGETITGVGVVNGYMVVYKDRSTYVVYGHSLDTIGYVGVNSEYGCVDGGSVAKYKGMLLALDRNAITACDGTSVRVVSDNVRPLVRSMRAAQVVRKTWSTTRTDEFDAGTYSGTYSNNGSVYLSTTSTVQSSTSDWAGGTVSGTSVTESGIRLRLNTGTLVPVPLEYGLLGGQLTAIDLYYENTKMTDGDWRTYCRFRFGSTITEGKFTIWKAPAHKQELFYPRRVSWYFGARGYVPRMRVVLELAQGAPYLLRDYPGSMWSYFFSGTEYPYYETVTIPEDVAAKGAIGISFIGLALDPRFAANTDEAHAVAPRMYEVTAYEQSSPEYTTSGTYTSAALDGGSTSVLWKMLRVVYTTAPGTSVVVHTRTSDNGSTWSGWEAVQETDWLVRSPQQKRYFQYRLSLATTYSSHTPIVHRVEIVRTNTSSGTYTSAKHYASQMSAWGNVYIAHSGVVTYAVRSATSASGLDTAPWTTVVNGDQVPAPSSHTWLQWIATIYGSTSSLDAVAITYYQGGGAAAPVSAISADGRYLLAYSSYSAQLTSVLVLDRGMAWTVYEPGVQMNALYTLSGVPHMMTSSESYRMFSTAPVHAYWTSGDLDYGLPNHQKLMKYIYVANKPDTTARAYVDWYIDHSTYAVHTTSITLAQSNSRYMFPGSLYGRRIRAVVRTTHTVEIHSISPYVEVLPLR